MGSLRRSIADGWWRVLTACGLSRERWNGLPRGTRRTIKAAIWVAIGLLLVWQFGTWKWSTLAIAAIVVLLVLPPYKGVKARGWRVGLWVAPIAALALAIAYPWYLASMPGLPIFGPFPMMSTMVGMIAFSMMALGLNFVVGYAGLLDLGYVAFYALGSYAAGWFASSQFAKQNVNFGSIGVAPGVTGIHFSMWLVLIIAGVGTALIGMLKIGRAHV